MDLVEIKNVNITKGNKHIIKNVSFNIKKGEKLAIIGGNGAGKSTLVEVISKINTKYDGEITYNFEGNEELVSKQIGMQFQNSPLPYGIKVIDILHLAAKLKRIKFYKNDKQKSKFEKLNNELKKENQKLENVNKDKKAKYIPYTLLDLNEFAKRNKIDKIIKSNGSHLSGGERQMVNISISLLNNPELVILDEPTTGLDVFAKKNIYEVIMNEHKEATLIYISHDMSEIERTCDRAIFIDNGKLVKDIIISKIPKKYGSLHDYFYKGDWRENV